MSSFDYSITYRLNSDLQESECLKLINSYEAEIAVNRSSGCSLNIGRFRFSIVLLKQILEAKKEPLKILEEQEELIHICEQFIELETGSFKEEFEGLGADNICIIQELDLLPGFRGKGVGILVIKDFYSRFKSMFSVLCTEVIPFQQATIKKKRIVGENLDDFSKAMRYEDGVFDEETVKLKLFAFFQKMGFTYLRNNLFYLSTAIHQPKLTKTEE